MAQHHHHESDIFIKEAEGHQRRYHKIVELTHSTTKAAGVMLLGAIIAPVSYTHLFASLGTALMVCAIVVIGPLTGSAAMGRCV